MAVGFPARSEEVRRYNVHFNYLSHAAVNALNALGWKYFAYAGRSIMKSAGNTSFTAVANRVRRFNRV